LFKGRFVEQKSWAGAAQQKFMVIIVANLAIPKAAANLSFRLTTGLKL
jgi:hypothetical protein